MDGRWVLRSQHDGASDEVLGCGRAQRSERGCSMGQSSEVRPGWLNASSASIEQSLHCSRFWSDIAARLDAKPPLGRLVEHDVQYAFRKDRVKLATAPDRHSQIPRVQGDVEDPHSQEALSG